MNIHDFWPDHETVTSSEQVWYDMIVRRWNTFSEFASIESRNGYLQPTIRFATAKGQELVRMIMFRVLEEFAESILAKEEAHWKEELIDGLNYLMVIPLLDADICSMKDLAKICHDQTPQRSAGLYYNSQWTASVLGHVTTMLAGELADTFRNRAWMNQAQDIYFSGAEVLLDKFATVLYLVVHSFESFDEFWRYFIAKDEVLQFRLRSKY